MTAIEQFRCVPYRLWLRRELCGQRHTEVRAPGVGHALKLSAGLCGDCPVGLAHAAGAKPPSSWADGTPIETRVIEASAPPAAVRAAAERPAWLPGPRRRRLPVIDNGPAPPAEEERMAKPEQRVEFEGETRTITEWAERFGVSPSGIRQRLKAGKNVDGSSPGAASPPPRATKGRAKKVAAVPGGAAEAVLSLAILDRLGIAHELVTTTPKGHVVLLPLEA